MTRRIHAFTSAAANYLPKVRLLFETLRRHHPDWVLHLALADAPAEHAANHPGDHLHLLADLHIPNLRRWVFSHSLIELATAIKPFALRRILARPDCAAAVYLDPDVAVFSALHEVTEALADADIVLTPHQSAPETGVQGIVDNEICTAQHGIYNLGFIAVAARREGRAFADFWADRTYRFGREDIAHGIYTDQRWVDFAPAYFDAVKVLRTARLNVAPWNLAARALAGNMAQGITVAGAPLGFYHFSQVDAPVHDALAAGHPAAAELVRWYRARTFDPDAPRPWAFAHFADGTEILYEQRLVYRLRSDLQQAFPDPFAAGVHSYPAWWRTHAAPEYPRLFNAVARAGALDELRAALTYRRVEDEFAAAAAEPGAQANAG